MTPKKFNSALDILTAENPQVIEMEKFVLGSMLLKNGEIIPTVIKILKSEDFYRPEHSIIFSAIDGLYQKNIIPTALTLMEELRQAGEVDKIGLQYILGIIEVAHTTAYTEHYCKIIKEKAIARNVIRESALAIEEIKSGAKPELQVIDDLQDKLRQLVINSAQIFSASKFMLYSDYFSNHFEKDVEQNQKSVQRKTGFSNIDEHQIFSPGLYVLGGTPASGKTTFAWQLLEQLARNGEFCIYGSYEMTMLELFAKSLCRENYIQAFQKNKERLRTPTAAEIRRGDDWHCYSFDEVLDKAKKADINLQVLELHNETVDELLRLLRPVCDSAEKPPVVVVDYLQIVPTDKDNIKLGIDDTVRKLKLFQRETGTTFIVISSFNRTNYAAPVSFESFKESGNIEYSADVVWGLQLNVMNELKDASGIVKTREIVDAAKKRQPRQIHLRCLKNRQGNNYDCYFKYYSAHELFEPCRNEDLIKEFNSQNDDTNDDY